MTRILAALVPILLLAACSESVSPRAERVFYRGGGEASWGTVCQLNRRGFLGFGTRGYISVAHVTENGTPLVGPTDPVTASDALSDWSFLGIDPAKLDAADYPAPRAGMAVAIHGFPARDRDGEVVPGVAYLDDPEPPFWWIELRDADGGIEAEGVIGGFSGSCVFDDAGALVAVVHANGFSAIGGTTNTFAKVVPVRAAILEAQGVRARYDTAPLAPVAPPAPAIAPPPQPAPAPLPPPEPAYAEPAYAAPVYAAPVIAAPVARPDPAFTVDLSPAPVSARPAFAFEVIPAPAPAARAAAPVARGWVF